MMYVSPFWRNYGYMTRNNLFHYFVKCWTKENIRHIYQSSPYCFACVMTVYPEKHWTTWFLNRDDEIRLILYPILFVILHVYRIPYSCNIRQYWYIGFLKDDPGQFDNGLRGKSYGNLVPCLCDWYLLCRPTSTTMPWMSFDPDSYGAAAKSTNERYQKPPKIYLVEGETTAFSSECMGAALYDLFGKLIDDI